MICKPCRNKTIAISVHQARGPKYGSETKGAPQEEKISQILELQLCSLNCPKTTNVNIILRANEILF